MELTAGGWAQAMAGFRLLGGGDSEHQSDIADGVLGRAAAGSVIAKPFPATSAGKNISFLSVHPGTFLGRLRLAYGLGGVT